MPRKVGAVPNEPDLLEDIDYDKLKGLPKDPFGSRAIPNPQINQQLTGQPDMTELAGISPDFEGGLSGAPAVTDSGGREPEKIGTEEGYPVPVAQDYPLGKQTDDDPAPKAQAQGVAQPPAGVAPLLALFPRSTIRRSPDGVNIEGFQLAQNVPQQIVQGRAGLVEAWIYNPGANLVYLCETYDEAQALINLSATQQPLVNAIQLPTTDVASGAPFGPPFKHECEAPLYAVCLVAGGGVVTVYSRYYKGLSHGKAEHHRAFADGSEENRTEEIET